MRGMVLLICCPSYYRFQKFAEHVIVSGLLAIIRNRKTLHVIGNRNMRMPVPGRSGRYVRQTTGYAAFIPSPLPPLPPVEMDQEMWALLSQADRALGRLDGVSEFLPNPDLFVFMYVRKEAVLSSQIEGTQASLIDVLEYEAQTLQRGRPQDVHEVVNYVSAMDFGLERLSELPLCLRLIREIHERLLADVRGSERNPGEFRKTQNWIGPAGCTLETATFVPPPPAEMLWALGDLEKFLHRQEPMPDLIEVGLAHAQFETIHPFLDGNGRVGRLLITFLLCQKKILKQPLLYLSYYFKRFRQEYYQRLQAIRDEGDWEGWLRFFLRGVVQVAAVATNTARLVATMREEHRELLTTKHPRTAGRALQLLEALYFRPIVTAKQAQRVTKQSYANANSLLKKMVQHGLLAEITGYKRNRRFAYQPYLDLFRDAETDTPDLGK